MADSSSEEKKVVNRETVRKIREMFGANVRYLEYEPETEKYGGDIYRKWGDAVQHVETEYSQIVTDKEFLVPIGVIVCIQWLDQHADYSTAFGDKYSIAFFQGSHQTKLSAPDSAVYSYEGESPLIRLRAYNICQWSPGLLLSLQRSVFHKKYYLNLKDYGLSEIRFGEAALELQPMTFGNIKHLQNIPAVVRDWSNSIQKVSVNKNDSSSARYPHMWEYPKNIRTDQLQRLTSCICGSADQQNTTSHSWDEYYTVLHSIMQWWFCSKIYPPNPKNPYLKRYPRLYAHVWVPLPDWIKQKISNLYESRFKSQSIVPHGTQEETLGIIRSLCDHWYRNYTMDRPIV